MRLVEWRKGAGKNLEDVAPLLDMTPSSLSKIERGESWVTGKTADLIREITEGAVTLDDLHDTWREFQDSKAAS